MSKFLEYGDLSKTIQSDPILGPFVKSILAKRDVEMEAILGGVMEREAYQLSCGKLRAINEILVSLIEHVKRFDKD